MGKISVFINVSVDGFYAGPSGEIDWFKSIEQDKEWEKYTHDQSRSGKSTLLFGRTTYDMMKNFWSSNQALQNDPEMAKVVNFNSKIVFSKSLNKVEENENWKNISIINEINPEEIWKLKKKADLVILGSGSIVQQFTNLNLLDEYSLVVVPIVLGNGKSLFKDVKQKTLQLIESRSFNNGINILRYIPKK